MIGEVTSIKSISKSDVGDVRASGLLDSHYSPKAKVVLNKVAEAGDGFIAMKEIPSPPGVIRLGSPADIEEYARGLYEALREGDQKSLNKIVIISPEGEGLATAIRDRLSKAAAG